MADYEDEMDVDGPGAADTVVFNSDNTNSKGKRSAANLPVEAEDSLPWSVVQRPLFEQRLKAPTGWKSTDQIPSMMFPATKISLLQSTSLSTRMYGHAPSFYLQCTAELLPAIATPPALWPSRHG